MTIYDVPVDDTVFFPVSGDMLRQMTHEEENGTGNPAKSSPDAADLNNYKEEQITMNDTGIVSDPADAGGSRWHPLWCAPADDNCYVNDDVEHHESHAGRRYGIEAPGHLKTIAGQVRRYSWDNEALLSAVVEKSTGESIELSWYELRKLQDELLPRLLCELETALGQEG